MISHIPGTMAELAGRRGEVFRGTAKFVGPNAVEVNGTRLEADNIVVATGSTPRLGQVPPKSICSTTAPMSRNTRNGRRCFASTNPQHC